MAKGRALNIGASCLGLALMLLFEAGGFAAEKVKFATSVRRNIAYDFPALAAEEQGLWQKNGLDGEWVPFEAGGVMYRAVAAGEIKIGASSTASLIQAIVPGLSIIAVAELYPQEDWVIVVRGDSPIRAPKELKGKRVAVTRRGGITYAFGLAMSRALGMERDIRLVFAGAPVNLLAAVRAGASDAAVESRFLFEELIQTREFRAIYSSPEFLPKEWLTHVIYAHTDWVKQKPDTIRSVIRTILQAAGFINTNPEWMQRKLKEIFRYSDETARKVYKELGYTKDGRMDPKAMSNIRDFLIDYDLVPKDKVPPVDKLYTNEFVK